MIQVEDAIINSNPAHILVYRYSEEENVNAQTMDVIIAHNDELYLLAYTSDSANYPSYLPIVKRM